MYKVNTPLFIISQVRKEPQYTKTVIRHAHHVPKSIKTEHMFSTEILNL